MSMVKVRGMWLNLDMIKKLFVEPLFL